MIETGIQVKHNIEMGHRLSRQPGSKCFHLHGHSWWVHLSIYGPVDDDGMILEFGDVKGKFRGFLDGNFDHHMLLHPDDPLIGLLDAVVAFNIERDDRGEGVSIEAHRRAIEHVKTVTMEEWGIVTTDKFGPVCDPTVENVARMIHDWAERTFVSDIAEYQFRVLLFEAATNAAEYGTLR